MKEHRSDTGKRKKNLKSLASTPCVINSNTIRKSTQRRARNNVLTVEMLQQNQNKRKTTQNIFFKEKKKKEGKKEIKQNTLARKTIWTRVAHSHTHRRPSIEVQGK